MRRTQTAIFFNFLGHKNEVYRRLRREGGVSTFFFIFRYVKIWNAGVQELFTEFKKLALLKFGDVANSAPFATCREMYRISHIVKFGLLKPRNMKAYQNHTCFIIDASQ